MQAANAIRKASSIKNKVTKSVDGAVGKVRSKSEKEGSKGGDIESGEKLSEKRKASSAKSAESKSGSIKK
jgi:hypothetical protein